MKIGVITLFPEIFTVLEHGILGRAFRQELVSVMFWNPRDFTEDKRRTVDDRPYGGGPGMVLQCEPVKRSLSAARSALPEAKVVLLTPQGKRLDQQTVKDFAERKEIIFLAGRYEGIDERIIETDIDEECSIGDYVLNGGEIPTLVLIEAITRLLPGALGDEYSAAQDSFMAGILDYPHYTRPEEFNGIKVPEVLVNGDHAAISRWRMKQALGRTWLRRPDLLQAIELSKEQKILLEEFIKETD